MLRPRWRCWPVIGTHHIVGQQRVIVLEHFFQVGVAFQALAVLVQHLVFGDELHPGHMRNAADGFLPGGGISVIIDERNRFVLLTDIGHHGINISAEQKCCANQNHTDDQHAHRGKRHHFVCLEVMQALPHEVGKTGKTHGIPSYLQISPRRTHSRPLRARPWRQRSSARQKGQRCRRLPCRWPA